MRRRQSEASLLFMAPDDNMQSTPRRSADSGLDMSGGTRDTTAALKGVHNKKNGLHQPLHAAFVDSQSELNDAVDIDDSISVPKKNSRGQSEDSRSTDNTTTVELDNEPSEHW